MKLIEHLEDHLGIISSGWGDQKRENGLQVVYFKDQPFEDINTYATVGLSDIELSMDGSSTRQELIFVAYRNFSGDMIASFLITLAESMVASNKALLRGDVIGPSGPIIFGSALNSIFSAPPMIFPESFANIHGTGPVIILPWIIPIHEEEANFVRLYGWTKFEELLERENPELWDLRRSSIV